MNTTTQSFDQSCSITRSQIKDLGNLLLSLKVSISGDLGLLPSTSDKGEMIANITLAYRHLEDASMRMGKAIQAYEGGKSIYDSNDAQRVSKGTGVA